MRKKRLLSAFLTLAVAVGAVAGCSSSQTGSGGSTEEKGITVGVFDMGTLYLMQTFDEMGYYKDNGANVKFEYFPVYSDAMTAFNTSNVDMICYACPRRYHLR